MCLFQCSKLDTDVNIGVKSYMPIISTPKFEVVTAIYCDTASTIDVSGFVLSRAIYKF